MTSTTETTRLNSFVRHSLNGMIHGVNHVFPSKISIGGPLLKKKPFYQTEIGVLIGLTGAVRAQVLIEGDSQTFRFLGKEMFGVDIEGDILESFVGELGNMIIGNMVTFMSKQEIEIDISPPTVMVGHTKFTAFEESVHLPIDIDQKGKVNVIMILKGDNEEDGQNTSH